MSTLWSAVRRRFQRSFQPQPRRPARRSGFERLEDRQMLAADFVSVFQIAGPNSQRVLAVDVDAPGDRFVVGNFRGAIDLDPDPVGEFIFTNAGTTASSTDGYVAKYAADGTLLWGRRFTGSLPETSQYPERIVLDPIGDAWITFAQGNDPVDYGNGFVVAIGGWVSVKLDGATGETLTANIYGDGINVDRYFDASGSVYLAGVFTSPTITFDGVTLKRSKTNNRDGFVIKYDAAGNLVWARKFDGYVGSLRVQADASGNVFLVGHESNRTDFDPGNGKYILSAADSFVVKLDAGGNFQWAAAFANGRSASSNAVTNFDIDAAGNLYLTGNFYGDVDFDPSNGTRILSGPAYVDSTFIARLNGNGTLAWANGMLTQFPWSGLRIGPSGQLYVMGVFHGTVDFDPSSAVNTHSAVGFGDVFVARYDLSGAYEWSSAVGGPSYEEVFLSPLAIDPTGDLVIGGTFRATADFDPGPGEVLLTSTDTADNFLEGFLLTLRDTPAAAPAAVVQAAAPRSPALPADAATRSQHAAAVRAVFAESRRDSWRSDALRTEPSSPVLRAHRRSLHSSVRPTSQFGLSHQSPPQDAP